jgi:hypothetical protein
VLAGGAEHSSDRLRCKDWVRMTSPTQPSNTGPGISLTQRLPVIAAVGVLGSLLAMEVLRGVDSIENVALLLFAGIAVASYFGVRWGVGSALFATVLYGALRRNALDAAGAKSVNNYILARGLAFFVFGSVLGSVISALRRSAVVEQTADLGRQDGANVLEREVNRAKRHHRPLSVITIDLTTADQSVDVSDALRSSDYLLAGRGVNEGVLTIILPETDAEGAQNVARRLATNVEPRVISLGPDDNGASTAELEMIRQRAALSTLT